MGIQKVYNRKTKRWEEVTTASGVPISDLSNSFTATDVEGALQEAASWNTKYSNAIDSMGKTLETHDEKIEYLMINGGGGSGGGAGGSVLPNLTSTLTGDIVVSKGKEIIIPVFFTSPNMGNGTLIVMLNGVQKDSITLKQGSTDVNLGSFTELRNTLKIYVKDRAGLLSNELSWTVINGGIGLTLDFDYLSDYTTGYDILMRYYIDTEEKHSELHVTVDGQLTMQSCEVGYNEFYFTGLAPGIHAVEVKALSGNYMSETYTFNLVVINSESLYVSSSFNNGSKIVYGLPISIPYRSSYKDDTPITINLYLNNELQKTLTAKRGSYAWTLNNLDIGTYTYKIEGILGDKTSKVEGTFEVIESDYTPVKIATAGLRYRLDPTGRSNEDQDKEVFTYSNGMGEITTTLYGCNFSSNGWVDGVLRLDGGAYGIIDYSPWENNVTNGSTIEVVFKSTDIGKPNTKVLEYKDTNTNKGLYVGLESAYMSSTSKQNNVPICPGEKTTVSFVVDRKNKFCKVFVNGICTRAFILSDSGSGTSTIYESLSFQNGKIYINANNSEDEQGVVDIYDIRIYERTLSDDDLVKNVIALETDLAKQEQMYSFMFENNTLPVMRLTGDTTDMSNIYKKVMRAQYSSPNTEKYGQPFDLNYCKVYWQGTSSLDYVRKNYNIELYDENMAEYYYSPYPNGVEDYIFCLKCDYMESSHARNIGITRLVDTYFYNTKNPAQQKDAKVRNCVNGFPILLYVNDEFMGVYNFNIDRYSARSFGYTDPDKCLVYEISANSDTTAGAFFKYNSSNKPEIIGNVLKYYQKSMNPTNTFNNDNGLSTEYIKVTPGSTITFNPGDKWTSSNMELLLYNDRDNTRRGTISKGTSSTISSSIKYIRLNMWSDDLTTLPNDTININGKDYTLKKVSDPSGINGVINESTQGSGDSSGEQVSELDYYAQDFMCLYPPTKAAGNDDYGKIKKLVEWVDDASDEEFVSNLEQHFNKEYLIKYIIFAYVFSAVDSLGKNMKLASWDGGDIWYLQIYDADTSISLDNSGFIKFDPDVEVGDENVYNTTESRLWSKVLLLLQNDIKTTYAEMRQNGLSLDNIMECIVEEQIDKIPATYYNKDMQTKYLDFGNTYLYALHGNDKQHIKLWLEERLLYLDTLWDYDASVTDFVSLRSSKLGSIYMDIETFRTMYLKVKWRNDTTGASTQKLRVVKNGEPTRFTFESKTNTDQEIRVYGGKYIKSLGDLSNLEPTTITLIKAPKINNLICHSDKLINTDASVCVNLSRVDLSGCTNLGSGSATSTSLDVSGCTELKYLNIQGTALQGVQLNPRGSNIKEIWYPQSIEEISITNCPQLKTLGLSYGHNCKSLTIVNCPNIEAFGNREWNVSKLKYKYPNGYFLGGIRNLYLDNSYDVEELAILGSYKIESITVKNMSKLKEITVSERICVEALAPNSGDAYQKLYYPTIDKIKEFGDFKLITENCPNLTTFSSKTNCWRREWYSDYAIGNTICIKDKLPTSQLPYDRYYQTGFHCNICDLSKANITNINFGITSYIAGLVLPNTIKKIRINSGINFFKDDQYDYLYGGGYSGLKYNPSDFGWSGLGQAKSIIYSISTNKNELEDFKWKFKGLKLTDFDFPVGTKADCIGNTGNPSYADFKNIIVSGIDIIPENYSFMFNTNIFKSVQGKIDFSNFHGYCLKYALALVTDDLDVILPTESNMINVKIFNYIISQANTTKISWKFIEFINKYVKNMNDLRTMIYHSMLKEQIEEDAISLDIDCTNWDCLDNNLNYDTSTLNAGSNLYYIDTLTIKELRTRGFFKSSPLKKLNHLIINSENPRDRDCSGDMFRESLDLESVGDIRLNFTLPSNFSKVRVVRNSATRMFLQYFFYNCVSLKTVGDIIVNKQLNEVYEYLGQGTVNLIESVDDAFYGCSSLESIGDMKSLHPSYVGHFLTNCTKLKSIKSFPTLDKAVALNHIANNISINLELNGLDINDGSVDMRDMFNNYKGSSIKGLYVPAGVNRLDSMFKDTPNLISITPSDFISEERNKNSNVDTMNGMFRNSRGEIIPNPLIIPYKVTTCEQMLGAVVFKDTSIENEINIKVFSDILTNFSTVNGWSGDLKGLTTLTIDFQKTLQKTIDLSNLGNINSDIGGYTFKNLNINWDKIPKFTGTQICRDNGSIPTNINYFNLNSICENKSGSLSIFYSAYVNIIWHGTANRDVLLSNCTLTQDSLNNLIPLLQEVESAKLYLGTKTKKLLTDEQKTEITNKGWTII